MSMRLEGPDEMACWRTRFHEFVALKPLPCQAPPSYRLPASVLSPGAPTVKSVKRRLRVGINEVTRSLEALAGAAARSPSQQPSKEPSRAGSKGNAVCPSKAIVLVSRDVRPPTLTQHVHELAALTGGRMDEPSLPGLSCLDDCLHHH